MTAIAFTVHGPNRPQVTLLGEDGNAFFIIGRCVQEAKRAGWAPEQVKALREDMTSGDYNHVLQVALENFEVE
jgi:hypothetical protein